MNRGGLSLYLFERTTGEGKTLFGGGWDVLAPSGKKIDSN